jgi:hypothetical protein
LHSFAFDSLAMVVRQRIVHEWQWPTLNKQHPIACTANRAIDLDQEPAAVIA